MSVVRDRTLVVDFGVLPERPKLDIVQRFVNKLRLVPTDLRCIQLNNVRHCLLIEMVDPAVAAETAKQQHLKHAFRINETTKIAIPVYVDDNTVGVRVHDLPLDMPNLKIAEAMLQYGEVLTIRDEVWKNFFVGVPNGVRVLKMKLTKPVPSYITLLEHTTLATYTGQLITCRRCHLKRHPTKSCAEAAKLQKMPKKANNNPPAPVLPPADPEVVESQVIASHTEDDDDDWFTIVGGKGKTKRQLSKDDDTDTETISTNFDDDHCNNKGQPMDTQIKNKPKRRLPSSYKLT